MKQPSAAFLIAGLVTGFSVASKANACVVTSEQSVRESSDVIVDGVFFVNSDPLGKGEIRKKRTLKGRVKETYRVRWDPHPELTLPPWEVDCLVTTPKSGSTDRFALSRLPDDWYILAGRWQIVEKEQ